MYNITKLHEQTNGKWKLTSGLSGILNYSVLLLLHSIGFLLVEDPERSNGFGINVAEKHL